MPGRSTALNIHTRCGSSGLTRFAGCLERNGIIRTDELRRAVESIEPAQYEQLSYYERWIVAIEALLIEKGLADTRRDRPQDGGMGDMSGVDGALARGGIPPVMRSRR